MKPKKEHKNCLIAIRFKANEHKWVDRMAKSRGVTKSAFIRNLVLPSDYLFGLKKELTGV